MSKFRDKFKNSFFIVNKVYLFIIFIGLSIADFALAIYYFIFSIVIFLWKNLKARLPIKTGRRFEKKTFVYKETEDKDLKIDLWYPNNQEKKNLPLVYFCHGGGWISGFRNQPNNISWCKFLAGKGFAVASIDYRYGYSNTMLDILSDYIDGLEFLKIRSNELGLDKNNISLMGLSAGGHLSLLYATYFTSIDDKKYMDGIRSVVAYYSPSDLKDILIDENKSLFAHLAIKQTLKGSPTTTDDVYEMYSPISYLTEDMIPTLLVHGREDKTVPFSSSLKFSKEMEKLGVEYEFLIHKDADHSFETRLKDYTTINILEKTVRFIKKYGR